MRRARSLQRVLINELFLAAFLLAGCGADDLVRVELDEFSVTVEPSSVRPGAVAFEASNSGSVSHSLAVLQTDLAADRLPVNDSEVDVDGKDVKLLAETPDVIVPGARFEVSARLEPGDFVLICTVPGHYQSGMHAPFEVTGRP